MYFFSNVFYHQASIVILLVCVFIGLWMLVWGSHVLLRGAASIARIFHVTEYTIGVTVVAVSTSLPELFVSLQAVLTRDDSIALANIVGSNIANTMLLFMLLCFFSKKIMNIPIKNIVLLSIFYVLLLLCVVLQVNTITRFMGMGLLAYSIFYFYKEITVSRAMMISNKDTASNPISKSNHVAVSQKYSIRVIVLSFASILFGTVLLWTGSELFLNSIKELGYRVGASKRVIGIVFVALGTSLPELFVTLVSLFFTKQIEVNYTNIAEGNIIGSNILNILVVLGTLSTISPVSGLLILRFDIVMMSISGLWLFFMLFRTRVFQKITGSLMLATLIVYTLSLL